MSPPLDGIIVIDKPAGMTSAAVVARVKHILSARRVGHTGTLDPMATGVLPLCLGDATKIAGYLLAEDKRYVAELELGSETDTLDADGPITARHPEAAERVTERELRATAAAFVGPGTQVPPMYSALKHQGKRLHELARRGQTVDRPARPIHIHELELIAIHGLGSPAPTVRFAVHCSTGTYIRSLASDIGAALGCGAHLTALRRVQCGRFTLDHAMSLAGINGQIVRARMVSAAEALAHLDSVFVPQHLLERVANGLPMAFSRVAGESVTAPSPDAPFCLLTPTGALLALATVDARGQLGYRRVFKRSLLTT